MVELFYKVHQSQTLLQDTVYSGTLTLLRYNFLIQLHGHLAVVSHAPIPGAFALLCDTKIFVPELDRG